MRKILPLIIVIFVFGSVRCGYSSRTTKPTQRAVYHANRGVKFLDRGDLERAEIELKTAIELSPEYVEAYNNLGIIAKLKGNLIAAENYFKRAIELDESYAAPYSHLSMVYLDQQKLKEALNYGKNAVDVGPTLPMTHFNLALVYLAKSKASPEKNFDDYAEKELKIATELNPNMFEAHVALARLYKRQMKHELASIRYRLALGNHPEQKKIWRELGEVYQAMGDTDKANKAFKYGKKGMSITEGTEGAHPSVKLYLDRGLHYMRQKKYDSAIQEFAKAVRNDPNNSMALYRLGSAYLYYGEVKIAQGKTQEGSKLISLAIQPLQKALNLNAKLSDASYNLGLVYFRLGQIDKAEERWKQTLKINPDHERSLYNLGLLFQNKNNEAKTIEYLCRFTISAGDEFQKEKANAINIIEGLGGKCRSSL